MKNATASLVLVLASIALLPGCAEVKEQWHELVDPKPAAKEPVRSQPTPPKPATKPAPKPEAKPAAPAPSRSGAAAARNPLGLSEAETRAAFGPPAETRPQSPGQLWVYKAKGCEARLHLYPDVERGGLYVVDAAATGAARDQCLGRVQAARPAK